MNKEEVLRLRKQNASDRAIFTNLLQSDPNFKQGVERVQTANPTMGGFEQAKFPSAMIDLYFKINSKNPDPVTSNMAIAATKVATPTPVGVHSTKMENPLPFGSYLKDTMEGIKGHIQAGATDLNNQSNLLPQREGEGGLMAGLKGAGNALAETLPQMGAGAWTAAKILNEPFKPLERAAGEIIGSDTGKAATKSVVSSIPFVGQLYEALKTSPEITESVVSYLSSLASKESDDWSKFKSSHPVIAAQVEALPKVASLPIAVEGTAGALGTAENLIYKAGQGVAKTSFGKALTTPPEPVISPKMQELAQPKPSKNELFKAAKEDRAILNSKGEPVGIKAGDRDVGVAKALQKAGVKENMSASQATTKASQTIKTVGKEVEADIAAHNYAFNDNEFNGIFKNAINEAEKDAVIATAPEKRAFESIAKSYQQRFQAEIPKANGNRFLAAYRTRKAMDALAPAKTFGGDATMNAKVNAFRYFRDGMNDFMAAGLESQGSNYSGQMKYMSDLFRALDNLETKIPRGLSPTLGKKIKSAAIKGAAGLGVYEAAKKLNPF